MSEQGVDAYFVPSVDPHQSEYVPLCWQRRAWLSGFDGSAGDVLVTQKMAGLWTDGRYFIQAARQLKSSGITLFKLGQPKVPTLVSWLSNNLQAGDVLGADPRLLSKALLEQLEGAVKGADAKLKLVEQNLVDAIWQDQPAVPAAPAELQPAKFAGESVARKLKRIRKSLAERKADALVLTTLDAVAWTFNLRGRDVPYNPVLIAYAIVTSDSALLFCEPGKLDDKLRQKLSPAVEAHPYAAFGKALGELAKAGERVWVDPNTVSAWVLKKLKRAPLVEAPSPVLQMKAQKNPKEIAGMRAAHVRDGVAMVRFLSWLEKAVPQGGLSEMQASERLEQLRAEGDFFRGISFAPISGYAGHGAIVHYSATEDTASTLRPEGLYLIDSGGQYQDGTTDITRTVLLGKEATAEQRDHFTRVLKGHIALAVLCFPQGTAGRQIDAFARSALWQAGLDYAHGTGHGVGAYLNVHEGPQSINATRCTGAKLEAGNILSNEPGFYLEGQYGIRTENLMLVVKDEARSKNGRDFFRFETLTLCPIDHRLIDVKLLTSDERAWINDYHTLVRETLTPLLDKKTAAWLKRATKRV
jgi:Xaa-Pro aminopeptidase